MNNIVNWEYYSSLHNVVSENDFSKAEQLAEKEVALVIGFPKWEAVDDTAFYFTQLKDCICNVIDKMASTKASGVGKGVHPYPTTVIPNHTWFRPNHKHVRTCQFVLQIGYQ